jgi:hypothetical protein
MPHVLNKPLIVREVFDPTSREHVLSFDVFLKTGNWGDVQFYPELPYVEVPMTVLMKFAEYHRDVQRESAADRVARIGSKKNLVVFKPTAIRQQRVNEKATFKVSNDIHFENLKGLDAAASD